MSTRLRSVALFALFALVPAGALAALLCGCPRRPEVGPDSTPLRLVQALHEHGIVYEDKDIPRGDPHQEFGFYLKRPGDTRSWPELADPNQAIRPERWKGYVRITRALPDIDTTETPNRIVLGPFLIVGDAAEIRRIVEALR